MCYDFNTYKWFPFLIDTRFVVIAVQHGIISFGYNSNTKLLNDGQTRRCSSLIFQVIWDVNKCFSKYCYFRGCQITWLAVIGYGGSVEWFHLMLPTLDKHVTFYAAFGSTCNTTEECINILPMSECISGQCTCTTGYYYDNSTASCVPGNNWPGYSCHRTHSEVVGIRRPRQVEELPVTGSPYQWWVLGFSTSVDRLHSLLLIISYQCSCLINCPLPDVCMWFCPRFYLISRYFTRLVLLSTINAGTSPPVKLM